MQQIITILPDGSLFGLQHKQGQGVDLRQFGKADIKRATLIEWEANIQKWYVRWADSDDAFWTEYLFDEVGVDPEDYNGSLRRDPLLGDDPIIYFPNYEEAVAAEVAVIQAMQMAGKLSSN